MTRPDGSGPGATRPPAPPGAPGGPAGPSSASRSPWSWLLPALTFLVGCVLGGAVIAAGTSGDEDGTIASDTASQAPEQEEGTDAESTDVVVRVPQSCLDAADAALVAAQQVDDAVAAVGDLDARRLQEIVDEVQQLQPDVRESAERCRSTTGSRLEDGVLATPMPAPTPTP
jgi:hypothetical protein